MKISPCYRVIQQVAYLGWVDVNLGCSTSLSRQLVAIVAAHQPGELLKSKSTQPRSAICRIILYFAGPLISMQDGSVGDGHPRENENESEEARAEGEGLATVKMPATVGHFFLSGL